VRENWAGEERVPETEERQLKEGLKALPLQEESVSEEGASSEKGTYRTTWVRRF
jgi:hypothetical protein